MNSAATCPRSPTACEKHEQDRRGRPLDQGSRASRRFTLHIISERESRHRHVRPDGRQLYRYRALRGLFHSIAACRGQCDCCRKQRQFGTGHSTFVLGASALSSTPSIGSGTSTARRIERCLEISRSRLMEAGFVIPGFPAVPAASPSPMPSAGRHRTQSSARRGNGLQYRSAEGPSPDPPRTGLPD